MSGAAAEVTAEPIRTAHASGLGAVARELAGMHRAMLRGGDDDRSVRLSVMTLVVACAGEEAADRAAEVIGTIAARHPARALLVIARRDGPGGIEADLQLACHIAGGSQQVCAETVRLRVGGEAAQHLGSVVAPLLLPDVPVMLWVAGAAPLEQALAAPTLAMCERVVLDSSAWTEPREPFTAIAGAGHQALPVVDLAWLRLRPWREFLARAVDAPTRRRRLLAGGIGIRVMGDDAAARLLGGWLAARLESTVEPLSAGPLAAVELEAGGGALRVRVAATEDGIETAVDLDGERVAARRIPLTAPVDSDLVGAALEAEGTDPVYLQAVRAALA